MVEHEDNEINLKKEVKNRNGEKTLWTTIRILKLYEER